MAKRVEKKKTTSGEGSPWYRMGDMVRLFDVDERTIRKWASSGRLPKAVKQGGKWSRWDREKVDGLIRKWKGEAG